MSSRVNSPVGAAARLAAILALATGPAALSLAPRSLAAQETGRITGTVVGEARQPVENVQVVVVGTRLGALTGADGRYTITGVAPGTQQVRAQRIGYQPLVQAVTVAAGEAATLDFQLTALATNLSEVVTVGYTNQQRRDVSDATSTVRAEDIQDQTVATVEEALRGRVPGVQINASGEPGRPAQVIVRGQNFLGNPTPLYVVDGMYLRENPNLNPDDIESIEVLKDASAAAQYGSQAANGVIVIRTRRGRAGDNNRVEVHSYYGTQDIPKRIDMMSAREWATLQQTAFVNAGKEVPSGITDVLTGKSSVNTDWQDAVFRSGRIQNHNLTVSGGASAASYLISGSFLDQQGSVIATNFRRYSVRVNSEAGRGRLTLGENVAVSRGLRQGLVADPLTGFPLTNLVRMLPTIPVRDPSNPSGYGYGNAANPTYGTNPVGLLEQRPSTETSNQVIGSAFGELRLIAGLRYRLNLGANYENYGRSNFQSINQIRNGSPNQFAELNEVRNDFTSLLAENLLNFDNEFSGGAHRVSAVAGYTQQTENADDVTGFCRGFVNEDLRTLSACDQSQATSTGTRRRTVLQSYLLRANYTLLDRYLLTGSVRRDGSSRFGPSHRWGTFSAASVGWIVSDEGFFQALPGLNRASFVKLRASTGTLGNQDIGDYRYSVPVDQNRLGYTFGGTVQPGATVLRLANPDIKWQENKQDNVGLDLGFMQGRLSITADLYRSTSKGLLVEAPLPWSLGVGEDRARNPVVNAGSMRNSGFELGATYHYGRSGSDAFRLNTTASLTTTKNTVLSLGNGGQPLFDETGVARTAVGSPVGTFYVIRTAGIFQSDAEVQQWTTTVNGTTKVLQPDAKAGDLRFVDANKDGIINDDDRVEVGNGAPKVSGGVFFDGGVGRFDFGLNLRGAAGFKIFNAVRYWTDRMDEPSNHRKGYAPWTPQNRSATTPRALAVGNPNDRFLSDRWIENGRYLRLQNIVLGYTLPPSLTGRLFGGRTSTSRLYLNVQNVHTFSGYTNWDPETLGNGSPLGRGVDEGRVYPNVRTISVGLDLRL